MSTKEELAMSFFSPLRICSFPAYQVMAEVEKQVEWGAGQDIRYSSITEAFIIQEYLIFESCLVIPS